MKGTAKYVLIMGETPNDRKASILYSIKLDREIIALFSKHDELEFKESISLLRQGIKDSMQEMIQLERWRRREEIEKDEPFKPRFLREKLAKMTDEEKEAYALRQAELQAQINELEYKMWEERGRQ